ncbi:hypothetical protein U1Q18_013711 [Sarracenia purpurea var. burkii]
MAISAATKEKFGAWISRFGPAEKKTAALVWLPIGGAVTGTTPGVLPRHHHRRPGQPRREIKGLRRAGGEQRAFYSRA